jgi:hypothetical protein
LASLGEQAEQRTAATIHTALPDGARLYENVRFVARPRADKPAHDGEADLVIVHPEHGLLVIETKAGEPGRDGAGKWFIGSHPLVRSPFEQAEAAKRDLVNAVCDVLALPAGRRPRSGHAVAFPDADLATLPRGHVLLGPDAPRELILDAADLADDHATRHALERTWAWWVGDGSRDYPLTDTQLRAIDEFLAPTVTLHRLLRRDVDDGQERLLSASRAQLIVLNQHRTTRRLEIVGPAGSGKSLVAIEKARRLAREGWRTLYVCFNQPLATAVMWELEQDGEPLDRRPTASTFHQLCETLGTRAGTLQPKTEPLPPDWWDAILPGALLEAIDPLPDERFQAIVVDEGQDFELGWLESLELLLRTPDEDVLWVFHDPGQALIRDDRVAELGLPSIELYEDYRSPAPVAEIAARFYRGPFEPIAMDQTGRKPQIEVAEPGRETVDAVRRQLHRLLVEEEVRGWDVAVLSGASAAHSDVWAQRTFGNATLWNGAIDDAGQSLRLPADQVPEPPPDAGVVPFETIRRFKGLERPVIVLCELPTEGTRLDALLYTALTRATTHVVVIAPPALADRLRR